MSFTYNVGCQSLRDSNVKKRWRAGESLNTVVAEELPKWNKAGGQVRPELTRRRAAEVAFFMS